MAKDNMWLKIGTYAFLGGIIIALCFGLYQASTLELFANGEIEAKEIFFTTDNGGTVAWILAVLGGVIGLFQSLEGFLILLKKKQNGFIE